MERVVIDITADASKLQPLLDKMKELGATEQKNAEQFSKNNNQQIQNVQSLKAQYAEAKRALETIADSSTATAKEIANAASKAAQLKSKIEDTQKTIAAFNPEAKFAVISQFARGVAGGFSAATGALAIFGKKSEDVQKALLKVQAAMAIAQGISEVAALGNAFKNLKAILAGSLVATQAQAAANVAVAETATAEAVATNTATVATKGFTAALLTNPFTIALAAITALVGALVIFSDESDKSAEKIKSLNKDTDDYKQTVEALTGAFENYKKVAEGEIVVTESLNSAVIKAMKARGASEKEIADKTFELSKQTIDEKRKLVNDEIAFNDDLLKRNKENLNTDEKLRKEYLAAYKKLQNAKIDGTGIEKAIAQSEVDNIKKVIDARRKQAIEDKKNQETYKTNAKLLKQSLDKLQIEEMDAAQQNMLDKKELNKKASEENKKAIEKRNADALSAFEAYQKLLEKIARDGATKLEQVEIDRQAALKELQTKAEEDAVARAIKEGKNVNAAKIAALKDPKYIKAVEEVTLQFNMRVTEIQMQTAAERNAAISKANEEAAKEAFDVAQSQRDEDEKNALQSIKLKYLNIKNITKKQELEQREEERKARIEKLKLDAKNREDDVKFQRETQTKINDIIREGQLDQAKTEEEIADEKKKQQIQDIQTFVNKVGEIYASLTESRIKALDQQIQSEDDAIKTQQELAARGQKNTLAFEEKRKAELERQRMAELERQRKMKQLELFINAFIEFSKAPNDPAQALPKALALVAVMKGAEAQFMEEGGIVGKGQPANGRRHKSGRDILVHAEHGEGILSTKEVANLGGEGAFLKLKESLSLPLTQKAMPIAAVITNTISYGKEIVNELQAVKEAVLNKKETTIDFDGLHNMVVTSVQSGMRHVTKYINPKPLI